MRISDWSSDVCSSDLRQSRSLHPSIGWALFGGGCREADVCLSPSCGGADRRSLRVASTRRRSRDLRRRGRRAGDAPLQRPGGEAGRVPGIGKGAGRGRVCTEREVSVVGGLLKKTKQKK